jgi:hypothetical protein
MVLDDVDSTMRVRRVSPLTPELVEDLARLLADALIADVRQYPNLAEPQAKGESTVESTSGHNRRTQLARSRAAAQPEPPR